MGLERLSKLVGRWSLSGGAEGMTEYRWAEGRRFLFQEFDFRRGVRRHRGIEVIGRLHALHSEPSDEIWSRVYSFEDGLTLDYVYEMEGDLLTIWFGHKGSGNRMLGRFDPGGGGFIATWEWPGGGYAVRAARIE